jgi:hypothetical protein
MAQQILLTIPDNMFRRAEQLAQRQARPVEDVLTDSIILEDHLPFIDWSEPDSDLDAEMEAYIAMHPLLKQKMMGQHVAVFDGELVDHDVDFAALVERIRQDYGDQAVWLTTVREEPIDTIVMRSPRLHPE